MPGASAKRQRAAFRAECDRGCVRAANVIVRASIVINLVFAVQDVVAYPERLVFSLTLRSILFCVIFWSLAWLRRPFARRHVRAFVFCGVLLADVMIDLMVLSTGGGASPRYAGLNVVLLMFALGMPWETPWMIAAAVATVGGYAVVILASGTRGPLGPFISHLFYLATTALMAVLATAFRERLSWREFRSRAALVDSLRAQGEFMAKMSHELRTPINVVVGYADVLLDEESPASATEARRLLEQMRSQGVLLERLISDLLDFAKTRAGKMDVHLEPLRIREVVERVAESFRPAIERKGLSLSTLCRGEPPELLSDHYRLAQILTNLIGNAIKFTDRGGISVEIETVTAGDRRPLAGFTALDDANASVCPRDQALLLLVRDTGIGIREDDLASLSTDFQQLDSAPKYGGTGLGLSISKNLAGLLGGRLLVRSRVGEGTTFALLLPFERPDWRAAA